jgi:hypothetical protein
MIAAFRDGFDVARFGRTWPSGQIVVMVAAFSQNSAGRQNATFSQHSAFQPGHSLPEVGFQTARAALGIVGSLENRSIE